MADIGIEVERREENAAVKRYMVGWPEWVCLGLFSCLLASMIPFHEPWADEAQAWMMARSLSVWQLFHTYLGYEGSVGLWHLLLWSMVRLHVGYTGLSWISGLIAVCGMYVFLSYSPFPRWLRLTVPFTFFFAYQYAVVARSYVLVPLLLFGVAAVWGRNPILIAVLLGLLANVSAHAAAISCGFAFAYGLEQHRKAARGESVPKAASLWIAAVVLFFMYAIAIWTAFPPRDVSFTNIPRPGTSVVFRVGEAIARSLCWAMWSPWELGLIGWPVLIWGIRRRGGLHFLLPITALVLFSTAIYIEFWHAGLMVPVILSVLWITWPTTEGHLSQPEKAMRCAIAVLVAIQIGWTVHAAIYDHFHDYSPDLKAARFLAPYVNAGDQVAVISLLDNTGSQAFHSVGIAPYFPGKLYMNQATPFWWWSKQDRTEADFPAVLKTHPRLVLVEYIGPEAFSPSRDLALPRVALIERSGYRLTRVFCAVKPERFSYRENICHLFFIVGP